jgi:thymidylate kinase
MLTLVADLVRLLDSNDVTYCHWKSNINLASAIEGGEDLDLLVGLTSAERFNASIASLGFKAIRHGGVGDPVSVRHFYGLDEDTGELVHLHVHYRLVTGGAMLKNYRFPFESILLEGEGSCQGIPVPPKAAELFLLVLRKTIESASVIESVFLYREKRAVQREIEWLTEDFGGAYPEQEISGYLTRYAPGIGFDQFAAALSELKGRWNVVRLFLLGREFKHSVRHFAINPEPMAAVGRTFSFCSRLFSRVFLKRRNKRMLRGGTTVAIVGADATGKSTTVTALHRWLSKEMSVRLEHMGKPRSSWLTWIPNQLTPMLRALLSSYRSGTIETSLEVKKDKPLGILKMSAFALRALMIAYDRNRAARKAYRSASKGHIVICDRYPTPVIGAMDSAKLDPTLEEVNSYRAFRAIARRELALYESMPTPDIVFKLSVSVEVALDRNESRIKEGLEGEEWIRRRHAISASQRFDARRVIEIDTIAPFDETFRLLKKELWGVL